LAAPAAVQGQIEQKRQFATRLRKISCMYNARAFMAGLTPAQMPVLTLIGTAPLACEITGSAQDLRLCGITQTADDPTQT
jgi:hypothetical protein